MTSEDSIAGKDHLIRGWRVFGAFYPDYVAGSLAIKDRRHSSHNNQHILVRDLLDGYAPLSERRTQPAGVHHRMRKRVIVEVDVTWMIGTPLESPGKQVDLLISQPDVVEATVHAHVTERPHMREVLGGRMHSTVRIDNGPACTGNHFSNSGNKPTRMTKLKGERLAGR